MSKVTLSQVGDLTNSTTARTTINSNTDALQTAFDNTLSRDGSSPNSMSASLDMDSHQIINLPAPGTVNSPARLIDVTSNPTIEVPPVGTSGDTVPFLSGNNTWSGTNAFQGITGTTATFSGNETVGGTLGVTGNTTIGGTLGVTGATTLGSTLAVTGNETVGGNLATTGTLTQTGASTFTGTSTFNGAVVFNGAVTLAPCSSSLSLGGSDVNYVPPVSNTYYLVPWTTIDFNQGSMFQSVASVGGAFKPPTGTNLIGLASHVWISASGKSSGTIGGKWIKNSTVNGSGFILTGTDVKFGFAARDPYGTGWVITAYCYDKPATGDYYNFYIWVDTTVQGTDAVTLNGNAAHTYAQATVIH